MSVFEGATRWQVAVVVGGIVAAGLAVGGGIGVGGYLLGQATAVEAPAPEVGDPDYVYTIADLEQAMAICEVPAERLSGAQLSIPAGEVSGINRECVAVEMGAPEIVIREYEFRLSAGQPESGDRTWSNVHMVWETTDDGRTLAITVEDA